MKDRIAGFLKKIQSIEGITACALVSRDGIMLGNAMGEGFNEPWFAAMSATLFASAESASTIIRVPPPELVTLTSKDTSIIVMGAGERMLLIAVIPGRTEISPALASLQALAQEMGGVF